MGPLDVWARVSLRVADLAWHVALPGVRTTLAAPDLRRLCQRHRRAWWLLMSPWNPRVYRRFANGQFDRRGIMCLQTKRGGTAATARLMARKG